MRNGAKWVMNTSDIYYTYCTDLTQLLIFTLAYTFWRTVSLAIVAITYNNYQIPLPRVHETGCDDNSI